VRASPTTSTISTGRRADAQAERHSLLGRSRGLGKSTIDRDSFGQPLMLPVTTLLVASLLIPLTCTHFLGDSRPLSRPPERTASGLRAGAARTPLGLPAAADSRDTDRLQRNRVE
jgi:hypothetical protein